MWALGATLASPHPHGAGQWGRAYHDTSVDTLDGRRRPPQHGGVRRECARRIHRLTATTDARTSTSGAPTTHQGILAWVTEVAELTQPDAIHWCTGSDEEWAELTAALEASGTFTRLNPEIKPNSFYAASDPTDVARVEDRTYICSVAERDAGPTNNWMDPEQMKVRSSTRATSVGSEAA